MSIGLRGRKCGMTRIFTDDGASIPVTVVEIPSNRVTQVKTTDNDGYKALQMAVGTKKPSHVNKPMAGHYAKAGVEAGLSLKELRLCDKTTSDFKVGDEIKVDIFSVGQLVDVQGTTKGKGFQGCVKRHGFRSRNRSNISLSHRTMGSAGMNQTPGRVFKGKKMPGHLGNVHRTIQSLVIARIDTERNLLLIRGAIPGPPGGEVIVMPSQKEKKTMTDGGS